MKKLITKFFVAAAFVALFTTANAQIGVRIGANLANASIGGDDEGETKMRPGFSAGVFYQIQKGSLTIQPEINFAQQGTKFNFDFLGSKLESTFTMNYIQIPILVKYGFGDMEKLNFFVQAGPYLGLGIGKAKAETCIDGGDCETEETEFDNYDSFGVFYSDTEKTINDLLKSREENKPPSPESKKSKVLKQTNTEKPSIISNFSTFPSKN